MLFKKPKLKFKVLSIEECVEDIYQFLDNEESLNSFTSKNVLSYFNITKEDVLSSGKDIIREVVCREYNEIYLQETFNKFNDKWLAVCEDVLNELADIFDIEYKGEEEYLVNISINPVCPRYIEEKMFNCFYKMDSDEVIQT